MKDIPKQRKKTSIEVEVVLKKPKRYFGIDSIKGFGIWFMIIMHCLMQQEAEGQTSLFINTITNISPWWYPLLIPIAILSTWGPFFAFAYVTTLTYQIMHLIDKKSSELKKFILKRLLIGILILVLSRLMEGLVSYRFFERYYVEFPRFGIWSNAEVLDLIAWSGFIVPMVIWLLYGGLKIKNPYFLMLCLAVIIVLWVGISPTFWNLGELHILPWLEGRRLFFIRYLVRKMIWGRFRMFPVMGFGFLGGIYGVMLQQNFSFRYITFTTLSIFGLTVIGFAIWHFFIQPNWLLNFASEEVPIPLIIANLGLMPWLVLLFLRNQDFAKTEKKRVRAAKRTTWWRRYSLISLTGYALGPQIAHRIFYFFTDVWGKSVNRVDPGDPSTFIFAWNIWQLLAFIATMWVFWEIVIRLWEKVNFMFSVDWFLVKTMQLLTGQKMARMNLKPIIYGPNKNLEVIPEKLSIKNKG